MTGACVPASACTLDGGDDVLTNADWSSSQPVDASFGFDDTTASTLRLKVAAQVDEVEVIRRTTTITDSWAGRSCPDENGVGAEVWEAPVCGEPQVCTPTAKQLGSTVGITETLIHTSGQ